MTDSREQALDGLNTRNGRGLEIGPLYTPMATKDTTDVTYVDVHLDALREHYAAHPGIPVDDIVEVDFALIHEGKTRSIPEAVGGAAPFDWVIASHVIEHVPDVISWLQEIAEVLEDDGVLSLIVPDRRYCFDARRPGTTVGDMLLARHDRDVRPSVRAVFDHFSTAVTVLASDAWRDGPPGPEATMFDVAFAREMVRQSTQDEHYVDCHVWLFTPVSLVEQLQVLAELGLLEFTVASVRPTAPNDMEFFVKLRRIPRGLGPDEHAAVLANGFPRVQENSYLVPVSAREARLLDRKRRVMARARGLLRRVRR